ncbi:MAG: aspartate carbamoyltransferase catalytic subunit [Chloroflexi bacterium]|nr:aspartate carbamoyltransferase catalytic subunit [Chloroflexota bacterium]MBM3175220.1 aspartate carbamoyltransferase catalytic subunit [Chloroflexota bacterium]MBM4450662.1 aspartate carbamoyltransferase catalytic subunit [Chloroflexota bacterium]
METVESTTHGAIISGAFSPPSLGVWRHRHVLDLDDFSKDEVGLVFEIADAMSEVLSREVKQVPTLRGKTIVTMFYEASTRTRASFELAAKSLSAGTISLDAAKSSVSKGESLVDNLRTIQALGADVIVMRHPQSGAPYLATQYLDTAVINAGDGWHAHPSQALLDIYTVRRHLDDLSKLRIAIIGDIMHSRVARSNIWGMNIMGATVVLCGPPTLMPRGLNEFIERCQLSSVVVEPKLESALEGADVIMLLRLQLERQQSGLLPSIREYIQRYQLTERRLSLAKPYALVMHPGPVNEGIEVSPEIAHGAQSVIEEQVSNGVAIRMALLYLVAGGKSR